MIILKFFVQDFVMEAYADPLQYFEPDPPNETKPAEVLEKLKSNDSSMKVCHINLLKLLNSNVYIFILSI